MMLISGIIRPSRMTLLLGPQAPERRNSQQDWHIAEMTVSIVDMLTELTRREKVAGIRPDEDLDIFMRWR